MKNKTPDSGDRLTWKWRHGAATPKADFGIPLTLTDYEVCIYDSTSMVSRACAPADGVCDGRPCWKELRHGYKYRRRDVSAGLKNGLQIILKEGGDGKAAITVKGKGRTPIIPTLPLSQPVTVQIINSGRSCWEAIYSAPALKNDATGFKDKND
jgi:hypothetical protein